MEISKGTLLISKTFPRSEYPLIPHFYIAKLGLYSKSRCIPIFLIFAPKIDCGYALEPPRHIDCGYSLEPPRRGGSNVYPQPMF